MKLVRIPSNDTHERNTICFNICADSEEQAKRIDEALRVIWDRFSDGCPSFECFETTSFYIDALDVEDFKEDYKAAKKAAA